MSSISLRKVQPLYDLNCNEAVNNRIGPSRRYTLWGHRILQSNRRLTFQGSRGDECVRGQVIMVVSILPTTQMSADVYSRKEDFAPVFYGINRSGLCLKLMWRKADLARGWYSYTSGTMDECVTRGVAISGNEIYGQFVDGNSLDSRLTVERWFRNRAGLNCGSLPSTFPGPVSGFERSTAVTIK